MFRRLAIQSLEDRRLLAAQPGLPADSILQARLQPAIESRLEHAELSADFQASAARRGLESVIAALPLTREQIAQQFSQPVDGLTQLAIADLFRSNLDDTSNATRDLSAMADRAESRLGPLRSLVQESLSSPTLSEASQELSETRRELLENSDQLLDWAIEHIDASRVLEERIAANVETPPMIAEAIRMQVRDRLETRQQNIASMLEANAITHDQPLVLADEPAEQFERTKVSRESEQFEFGSKAHEPINANLDASYAPNKQVMGSISQPSTADSIQIEKLLTPKPQASVNSQSPPSEHVAETVEDQLATFFAEYAELKTVHPSEQQVGIEIGEIVGRVSSLNLLSALDATASKLRATVDEVRPRISIPVAVCFSALTVGLLIRIQKRRPTKDEEEIDVECATVRLADNAPRPSFGM